MVGVVKDMLSRSERNMPGEEEVLMTWRSFWARRAILGERCNMKGKRKKRNKLEDNSVLSRIRSSNLDLEITPEGGGQNPQQRMIMVRRIWGWEAKIKKKINQLSFEREI